MTSTYALIEDRIQKAIDAINTRENPNRAEIAREFRVPYDRLRSRLRDYQSKTAVRELHNMLECYHTRVTVQVLCTDRHRLVRSLTRGH